MQIKVQLQQLVVLKQNSYPYSKVGHCACGPAGLVDLSCGIRLTPLGVNDRQLFPCQLVKEAKPLVLLVH